METFKKIALEEINAKVHKKGIIEILDEGSFYYNFLILEVNVDKFNNTILKLVELSDTEFNEDNKVYRFSLEELIEGRAYFLKREDKEQKKFNNLFSNLKPC